MSVMEAWTQTTFRYRNDDGSETAATWRQVAGTDDTLDLDTTYRMRFLVTGAHTGGTGSFNFTCGFQYNVDAAGWNNITTTSTNVKAVASADTSWTITDDDVTTEQLAGGATFVAGHMDETGTCSAVLISNTGESEFELVFQLLSAQLSGGESVLIRMVDAGVALSTYTVYPAITVASAAGPTINNVTVTGANNYAVVTDPAPGVQVTAIRDKTLQDLDSAAAADSAVELRLRDRGQADSLVVTDPAPTATYVPAGGTINTVTVPEYIQYVSDAMWIPLVFSTARRERNRAQAETSVVVDSHSELRDRDRSQSDSLVVTDFDISLRERNRAQADSVVVLDDKFPTYVPSGSAIYNVTLQDLNSVEVADSSIALRERGRGQSDALAVDDVNAQWIENNEQQVETIDAADDAVEVRERNRLDFDSIASVDFDIELRLRTRLVFDSIVILDDRTPTYIPPGSVTYNRTLQDLDSAEVIDTQISVRLRDREQVESTVLIDAAFTLRDRYRSGFDSIVLLDDKTPTYVPVGSVTYSRTLQDLNSVEVLDNSIELRLRDRAQADSAVVLDDKNAVYVAAGVVVNTVTLSGDSLSVTDGLVTLRERIRQDVSSLETFDSVNVSALRNRLGFDDVVVSDSTLKDILFSLFDAADTSDSSAEIRLRYRTLIDSIDVVDNYTAETSTVGVTSVTLLDTFNVTDSIVSAIALQNVNFVTVHGISTYNIKYGIESITVSHGFLEETS